MFFHKMKYTFKYLFRSKMLLFWTFAFPIILGICFYFAFKDIESNEKLNVFDIAVVQSEEFNNNEMLKQTLKYLSENNEDKIFNIKYTTKEESDKLLEDEKIVGYIYMKDGANIIVKDNGINETILKYVVDEAMSNSIIMEDYIKNNMMDHIKYLSNNNDYTKDKTNDNISYTMIEYYTLIAMAALYSSMLSLVVINNEMANMSSKGKRISVAPVSKVASVLGSLSASFIVGLIGLAILFLFTIYGINVDYGSSLGKVIFLGVLGVLAGESMGVCVGTWIKGDDNKKTGILISISMAGSFFSGMMGITMKYIIDTNLRLLNLINPAAMITDGLYSLYYYDTFNRFNFDVISLLLFSMLMIILSVLRIRRVKYDSI